MANTNNITYKITFILFPGEHLKTKTIYSSSTDVGNFPLTTTAEITRADKAHIFQYHIAVVPRSI